MRGIMHALSVVVRYTMIIINSSEAESGRQQWRQSRHWVSGSRRPPFSSKNKKCIFPADFMIGTDSFIRKTLKESFVIVIHCFLVFCGGKSEEVIKSATNTTHTITAVVCSFWPRNSTFRIRKCNYFCKRKVLTSKFT